MHVFLKIYNFQEVLCHKAISTTPVLSPNSSMKLISTPYAFVHAMYSNTKAWLNSDVLFQGKTGENICRLMEAIWHTQTWSQAS